MSEDIVTGPVESALFDYVYNLSGNPDASSNDIQRMVLLHYPIYSIRKLKHILKAKVNTVVTKQQRNSTWYKNRVIYRIITELCMFIDAFEYLSPSYFSIVDDPWLGGLVPIAVVVHPMRGDVGYRYMFNDTSKGIVELLSIYRDGDKKPRYCNIRISLYDLFKKYTHNKDTVENSSLTSDHATGVYCLKTSDKVITFQFPKVHN